MTRRHHGPVTAGARFPPELMYAAARLYYLEDKNQAAVAEHLGTSRATVSRLLSEARRAGIVRIDVALPGRRADPTTAAAPADRASPGVDGTGGPGPRASTT